MDIFSLLAYASEHTKVFGLAVHPWKIVGWTGNLIFGCRFIIQWVASERAGRSIIPRSFWVVSALGSLCLLSYFAIYKQDSVGVLSTLFPLPIYLRNLWLQARHEKLTAGEGSSKG